MTSTPREVVPGGDTDRVSKNGGYDLYVQLQLTMAGRTLEQGIYALARSCASTALIACESEEEACKLLRDMADDAINELRLNWPNRQELLAIAATSYHPEGGRG